jgi:hypothetical protein
MGVQRMASEDSVENHFFRHSPMLAIPVDGVGKPDKLHDAFDGTLPALANQLDSLREDLIVHYTRGEAHVVTEERHDHLGENAPMGDLENQHVWIPGFREDRAGAELLRSHFEKTPSVPVLIQKELRLDEVAKGRGPVPFYGHAHASFAFNEAG